MRPQEIVSSQQDLRPVTKKPKSDQGVLVVDLDGTLVRTDMLHESF